MSLSPSVRIDRFQRRAAQEPDIIALGGGLPDPSFFPMRDLGDAFFRALHRPNEALQYGWPEGEFELRDWIALRLRALGAAVGPKDVVVTSGAQQAISLLASAVFRSGQSVGMTDESYPGAIEVFRRAGLTLVPWHDRASGYYVMPSVGNPGGQSMPPSVRADLLRRLQREGSFLIEDEARKAPAIASREWLVSAVELSVADVAVPTDAALRDQLAAHWTEIGLLEHASVAAFARFTLQLLSLGAPVELVDASQRAALDEVRHAELAFALASRYAGRAIGPGPLPLTGALDASSVEAILRTTVREGCIGETRAALEASRAAETCEEPTVRSVLETIAADEARHAELAWRVVRFIVSAHPETASVLAEEFGFLDREERALVAVDNQPLERSSFGMLGPSALARCHREAYADVIAPCARTLLAMTA